MNLKRILSAAAEAAIAAGAFSVQASAKGEKNRIITASLSKIGNGTVTGRMFDDSLYYMQNLDETLKFYSITQDDIDSWRDSGELNFTAVKLTGDSKNVDKVTNGFGPTKDGRYIQDERYASYSYEFNGKDSMNILGTKAAAAANGNHLDIGYDWSSTSQLLPYYYVTTPDGQAHDKLYYSNIYISAPDGDTKYSYQKLLNSGEYTGYAFYYTGTKESNTLNLAIFDKKGSYKVVWSDTVADWDWYSINGDEDCVLFSYSKKAESSPILCLYDPAKSQMTTLDVDIGWAQRKAANSKGKTALTAPKLKLGYSVEKYGDALILNFTSKHFVSYDIVISAASGKKLCGDKCYRDIQTNDGKMFLVWTSDDRYGYLDKDGKLLKCFDSAGVFIGSYAPVVENGKAYLVDRKMNAVTEAISADRVETLDSELFIITAGKKTYIATYASNSGKKDISALTVSKVSDKTYTGKAIKPAVTVKDGTKKLVKGKDYTVTYANNKKVGTATITITGKGNYTGTKTITFRIVSKKS